MQTVILKMMVFIMAMKVAETSCKKKSFRHRYSIRKRFHRIRK